MSETLTHVPDPPGSRPGGGPPADRYELLGPLGHGGMGAVFRARDRVLDRPVAVKFAHPGADPARFLREARLLAAVRSPNVVPVYDFPLLPDGRAMLVMGWVDGADLRQVLVDRGGRADEPTAVRWMADVAAGMLAAEDQGIVHRDLKPGNVLVDRATGAAVVTDFGLARSPAAGHLTAGGGLMGTPHYMAPEQAEDPQAVDTRADVYSFGATFYHALTGRPPFDGPSAFSVLFKHKTEPVVAPKALNPGLGDRTAEVVERCLAKNPADRFGSFRDVLAALAPAAGRSPWDFDDDPALAPLLAQYRDRRAAYRDPAAAPDVYRLGDGRTLTVGFGNLPREQVDAVVSSDDGWLSMSGGVSAAIRRAAGPEVEAEARRYGAVRAGRAVVTSAGRLPARFVFHGVTLGVRDGEPGGPTRDLIAEIVEGCFYHADTLGVRSIAFPLLGTGAGGFPPAVCLDTMFRCLARRLLHGATEVRDARVVLYKPVG